MGNSSRKDIEIKVKTGDVKGSGTDSNVYCILIDENGTRSHDIKLDCMFRDDLERGNVDKFVVSNVDYLGKFYTQLILPSILIAVKTSL